MGRGERKRTEAGEMENEIAQETLGRERFRLFAPPIIPHPPRFLIPFLFLPVFPPFSTDGASAEEREASMRFHN